MRLFLDCEFTELNATAKLISLALVAEDAREFYVELLDTWHPDDCSDFVKEIVLPQLWGGDHSCPMLDARNRLTALPSEIYSAHSIRRGFATWAASSGWDIKTLMEYVGWSDMKSALRYVEPAQQFGGLIRKLEG